jgi:hypothetical protein
VIKKSSCYIIESLDIAYLRVIDAKTIQDLSEFINALTSFLEEALRGVGSV